MVGNNGSFGGNPLVQHIGLGDATSVTRLVVTWPTSQTTQTFTGLAADQSIVITEGSDQYQVLPPEAVDDSRREMIVIGELYRQCRE